MPSNSDRLQRPQFKVNCINNSHLRSTLGDKAIDVDGAHCSGKAAPECIVLVLE
jgi:hypothetical protein